VQAGVLCHHQENELSHTRFKRWERVRFNISGVFVYRSPEMLLHGEAVSIDMALSCELAYGRGLLSAQQRLRVLGVMRDLRLPLWHDSCNLDLLMKVCMPQCRLA
jgi:3-dehydroquinate synthase